MKNLYILIQIDKDLTEIVMTPCIGDEPEDWGYYWIGRVCPHCGAPIDEEAIKEIEDRLLKAKIGNYAFNIINNGAPIAVKKWIEDRIKEIAK